MDADILAERILLDLKNTFKKDPLIDEFDVLPVHESHSNTCPVIHIEHKIALEDWCVKHVYVYAYSKFFTWRKKPYKVDTDSLLMWTSAILLINPETETVWNARKELVCQNLLLPENELKFSELVLSRKPKSSPVYAHRKWVLLELRKGCTNPCSLQQTIEYELLLCTRFANLYPNNYYAWCHRSWVLKEMCGTDNKTLSDELSCTEKWASVHVSDHCGFHFRQFLLSCLHNAQCHPKTDSNDSLTTHFHEALTRELEFLGGLQTMYPGHEALWYHRRYILHEVDKIHKNNGEFESDDHNPHENTLEFKIRSSYGNTGEYSNEIQNLHGNSVEFKVHSSYENAGETHGFGSENGEVASLEGVAQCKRHKLECAATSHQLEQEPSDKGKIPSKGSVKGTVHCKRHRLEWKVGAGWNVHEEEAFLKQLAVVSREGSWERALIKRHIKWLCSTLQWSLSLS